MRYGTKHDSQVRVHDTATIDDMVVIAGNVIIGKYARIGFGSLLLGDPSGAPITIGEHARLGPGTKIRASKHPITIEDEVSIGPGCIINYDNKNPGMPGTGPVRIGRGTILGPYCLINNHVDIGEDNHLGVFTRLEFYVTLGKHNRLRGCFLGVDPQDRIFESELDDAEERDETTTPTYVSIGDNNVIREGVRISRGTTKNADRTTRVGNGNFIMDNTHVAHDCIIHNNSTITTGCKLAGHCAIEDYVNLSGAVKMAPYLRIGRCAFITGNATVAEDVPPYFVSDGKACSVPNYEGIRRMLRQTRKQFTETDCARLEQSLGTMRDHLNGKVPLEQLLQSDDGDVRTWATWLRESHERKQQRRPRFKRGLETF